MQMLGVLFPEMITPRVRFRDPVAEGKAIAKKTEAILAYAIGFASEPRTVQTILNWLIGNATLLGFNKGNQSLMPKQTRHRTITD